MKTHSQKQVAEKTASGILELVKNAKKISDGSGKPPKQYENEEYISNSYLTMIWKELTGRQQFFGNEDFLKFGNELHKRFLTPEVKKFRLERAQETLLKAMLKRLSEETRLVQFMRGAELEKRSVEPIQVYGQTQMVKVILDIRKKHHAKDLKSTSATSEAEVLKSARMYGYFRQAFLYSEAKKIRDFDFEFISKKNNHPMFLLPVNDFPDDKKQGREESLELMSIHIAIKRLLKLTTK